MGRNMKKIALYPGTFDPVTNGHIDIITRAGTIFDEVIVGIAASTEKKPLFSLEHRKEMLKAATAKMPSVQVETFNTLLVDFAKEMKTKNIIRGLRAVSDFEYELQLSYANTSLDTNIETIFLMPTLKNAFISSSVVRAILKHDGQISHLVPAEILPFIDKDSDVYRI